MQNEIDYANFTPAQIKAAELIATPPKKLTNKEISIEVGVDERTIYRWKNDEKFREIIKDIRKRNRDWIGGAVDKVLVEEALKGKFRFVELYYKLQGDLVENKKIINDVDIRVTSIDGKTNEQLRKEAIEMEKKFLGNVIDVEVIEDSDNE